VKAALYLVPVLAATVFFLIRAEILGKRWQVYLFKPLSTLLVIAIAAASFLEPTRNVVYTMGVLGGLLFSLGGDIALMFQQDRRAFTIGLGLFLVAHVVYAVTFTWLGRFSIWDVLSTAVLLIAALWFYRLIQPNLGAMKGPVIAYMLIISVMVSRALSTLVSPVFRSGQALLVVFGALLFYCSDVILAANRYWRSWRYHRISLVFYYSGQLLIALAAIYFV
jgi:uncharacterized membrane protein YhhN